MNPTLLLLTNSFPYEGGESYLVPEIKYLSEKFDSIIIVPLNHTEKKVMELPTNCEVLHLNLNKANIQYPFWKLFKILMKELPLLFKIDKPISQIRYFRAYLYDKYKIFASLSEQIKLKELAKDNKVIVCSYWFNELAIISGFLKIKYPKLITISRAHGFDVFEEQNLNGYIPFRSFQLQYVDKVYSVSRKGEHYLKTRYPKYTHKINTQCLGTSDYGMGTFEPTSRYSICTCSIVRNIKRLELMPEILQHIKFNLTWHILGNGPDLEQLKKQCLTLPKNISIVFHGYLKQDELTAFYKNNSINLFCSLSSSEGLPVSMMEAISFGIPLMSTDVGGCSEICNEHTGLIIPKNFDAKKVAELITDFKESQKNTLEFRKGVRAFWEENFSAEKNYKKFAEEIIGL